MCGKLLWRLLGAQHPSQLWRLPWPDGKTSGRRQERGQENNLHLLLSDIWELHAVWWIMPKGGDYNFCTWWFLLFYNYYHNLERRSWPNYAYCVLAPSSGLHFLSHFRVLLSGPKDGRVMGLVFKRYFYSETWGTFIVFLCSRERCFSILPVVPALGSSAQPFCISRCCNSQTIKVYLYYRTSSWWILLYQLLPFSTPHPELWGSVCLFSFISRRES